MTHTMIITITKLTDFFLKVRVERIKFSIQKSPVCAIDDNLNISYITISNCKSNGSHYIKLIKNIV